MCSREVSPGPNLTCQQIHRFMLEEKTTRIRHIHTYPAFLGQLYTAEATRRFTGYPTAGENPLVEDLRPLKHPPGSYRSRKKSSCSLQYAGQQLFKLSKREQLNPCSGYSLLMEFRRYRLCCLQRFKTTLQCDALLLLCAGA